MREVLDRSGWSYPEAAAILTRAGLGNYDRSKVQKMTVGRKVTLAEAEALAKASGIQAPVTNPVDDYASKIRLLSDSDREMVFALIDRLPKADPPN
ncbi:hypothetical protein [Falsirhodobacter halotolerans]|uniref:hypothetical protein n=1 Tax=Falsirhodobacter halotolerans TaxID=1146892 RepID=UPI001FD0FBAF|nr:hypothetical protein [Falsirhodobacter halotolerans]MCJ8139374.1 hypothetical protein [Falsirhodobacter halotolerans]